MNIGSVAVSGLFAAQKRVSVSAGNIANARSAAERDSAGNVTNKAYEARRVQQTALPNGGVNTNIVIDENPTVTIQASPGDKLAAQDGTIELPNVDIAEELVDQKMASYDFRANLRVLQTQKELQETLIDVLA